MGWRPLAKRFKMNLKVKKGALFLLVFMAILSVGCNKPVDRPNILLITIDTLRADRLGCYGYKGIKTPNIDALAARGVLFEKAITPVPLTLPGHATILTGKYQFRQ